MLYTTDLLTQMGVVGAGSEAASRASDKLESARLAEHRPCARPSKVGGCVDASVGGASSIRQFALS